MAVSFSRVPRGEAIPSQNVLLLCHDLQVLGIGAGRCSAQMIQNQPIRDFADDVLIDQNVNKKGLVGDAGLSVSPSTLRAGPRPTAVLFHNEQCHDALYRVAWAAHLTPRRRTTGQGDPEAAPRVSDQGPL